MEFISLFTSLWSQLLSIRNLIAFVLLICILFIRAYVRYHYPSIIWFLIDLLTAILITSTFLRKFLGLRVIGLTGGISSGKSTCTEYFEHCKFEVIDFDEVAHDIYAVGRAAWSQIKKEFGDNVLKKDWTINRSKLGEIVWNDRKKLKLLTSITRIPILKEFLLQLFLNIFSCRTQILDAPLPIENKLILYLFCDSVIMIYCNKEQQLKRLMRRDNITKNEAMRKIDKQMDIEDKRVYIASSAKGTIIDNSSDLNSTKEQLSSFMQSFILCGDANKSLSCSWKQAMKPTKLSFIISTVLCIGGYTFHRIVCFEFF